MATAIPYIAGAILAYGAKESHDAKKEAKKQREATEEYYAKLDADAAAAKVEAENVKRRKQIEEIGRKGRRASILTGPSGSEDTLGVVSRPSAKPAEMLG